MAETPFFGPFDVTRSTNFADNQCINLRPTVSEIKDGRSIGVFYGTPGLDLLVTVGPGPINGEHPLGPLLYVVSGTSVYTVTTGFVATLIGQINGDGGLVSMTDNGSQLAIFSDSGGWVAPAGHPLTGGTIGNTGYPLTGGTIGGTPINFAIGDTVTLAPTGGTQTTPAIIQITGATAGVPTAIMVLQAGVFTTQPTGFTQLDTSGLGSGFALTAPTYGALIQGGQNYGVGDWIVLLPNDGTASAAAILEVATITGPGPLGSVASYTIVQTGAFQGNPTGFVQKNTTGSGSGFILTSPTYGAAAILCAIALPFTPLGGQTISAVFQDGFVLINQPGTNTLWQCLVDDLSVWPALNFATADAASDNVQALLSLHRLIFAIKQRSIEVWVDAGTAGFAFQTEATVSIDHGTPSGATVVKIEEALILLTQSDIGHGVVHEILGFTAHRVSTFAIETLIAAASDLSQAFAYAYLQEGHHYYVLTIGKLTLVYDKTQSDLTRIPHWHQWLSFSGGQFNRHWGNAYAFFANKLVLGDYRNGNLYALNLDTLTDNGTARKWVRTWRALPKAVMQPMRFSSLQIDMQTGNVPDSTNPQVMLEWSDDGGNNWSTQLFAAVGPPGATAQRVRFTRLGSTRRNSGLDRTFRLSATDPFPVALTGAELDI